MKWNQRRRQSGKVVKTYPPEIKNLIRWRLGAYMERHGLARFDLAYDVSSWEQLSDWYPAASEWQNGDRAEWDDQRGITIDGARPKKRDYGFPITQRFFDLWFGSKSKAGEEPDHPKLDAVVHYMIDAGIILSAEVLPDERGFALSNAIRAYVGSESLLETSDWDGSFELKQTNKGRCILYKLRAQRLPHGPTFLLLGYSSVKPATGVSSKAYFDRLSKATVGNESRRSGWAIRIGSTHRIALLRPLENALPTATAAWGFNQNKGEENLALEWCTDVYFRRILEVSNIPSIIFSRSLQINTEIDYSLGRRGDKTENLIRQILGMKDFEDAANGGKPSELDMKFIDAALWAADDEDFVHLEQLLTLGADINAIDPTTGATALLSAAHWGAEAVADFLLKQPGIDVLIKDQQYGFGASEMAIKCSGKIDLAERLMHAEIDEERRRGLVTPKFEPREPR